MTPATLRYIAAAIAVALSSAAGAQDATPPVPAPVAVPPTFDALDTDDDGFIARTELPADHRLAADWAQYDADNDARLARADFDRYAATLPPAFLDLDQDRDGFIARSEVAPGHALLARFAEYDTDSDSRLARGDFDRYLADAFPDFAALDKNGDGRLTRAELPSDHVLYKDFARFDADSDTKLTRAEFDARGAGAGTAPVASTDEAAATDEEREEAE